MKGLAAQTTLNRLPPPEPSRFFGNPLEYPEWKSGFNALIDTYDIPEKEKIHFLKKYLGGRAREMVEG